MQECTSFKWLDPDPYAFATRASTPNNPANTKAFLKPDFHFQRSIQPSATIVIKILGSASPETVLWVPMPVGR